jgi:glyoxylase-like metal-dependent hydrolase (beta-lactamase superfamily II)
MTHLHVDHTSGMRLLPAARFTCSRREWAAARGALSWSGGYVRNHLPPAARMDLVDLRDGEAFGPFQRTLDWLGDGSIRLLDTPGHTVGHLSVLLRVVGARQVLLVGDAAYTRRNIDEQVLPLRTADDDASRRSLHELHAFATAHPDALLIPSHDPDAWRSISATAAQVAET